MFVTPAELEQDATIEADLCIVGAGPAGITVAMELLQNVSRIILDKVSGGITCAYDACDGLDGTTGMSNCIVGISPGGSAGGHTVVDFSSAVGVR